MHVKWERMIRAVLRFSLNSRDDASLGPGSAGGGKGKKTGWNRKNTRERNESRGGLRSPIFFSLLPQCGAWSQAKMTVKRKALDNNYERVIWEKDQGDSWGASRLIFGFAPSHFRGPDYLGDWNRLLFPGPPYSGIQSLSNWTVCSLRRV